MTEDSFMRLGQISYEGEYFTVEHEMVRNVVREAEPETFFSSILWISPNIYSHARSIYGWIDLLGDLGGVTEVIMICFGFILFPISEFSFILKASKKFYLARTKMNDLFTVNPGVLKEYSKDFKNDRYIQLRVGDKFKLYLSNLIYFPGAFFKNKEKLTKLYQTTSDKLESELNIVKIIRSIRDLKILMKSSLMSDDIKK